MGVVSSLTIFIVNGMSPSHTGTVCGVRNKDGEWVRGVIERVSWGNPAYTTLQLIDYGYTNMVSMGRYTPTRIHSNGRHGN